ncbi:MAG: TonB family protein [Pseudomonadota bacterium]
MNAVAARRSGVPSPSIRLAALVLAALASGIPLLMLLLGLSIRTIEAIRSAPVLVELIPLPTPVPEPPPPPPQTSAPRVRPHPAAAAAAPAPLAAPPPATPVDSTPNPVAPPAPPPAPASGSGTSAGAGAGNGTGGSGTGGNGDGGTGTGGGALLPPSWVTVPGYRELAPHNPAMARNERVNGSVLLACHGTATRRLTGCRVVQEAPRGYGFGKAGIAAARSFRINPPMRDGRVDEAAWVGIPISFNNHR